MSMESVAVSCRPPFQKKKVALLLAYSGANYSGLQLNPGATTIESVVMEAASKAGLIWDRNQGDPKKIDWQRSCRTDKGVHAAGNVISFKALLVTETHTDDSNKSTWSSQFAVRQMNKWLPEGIRCLDIIKVTNSFDAHTQCDSRYYEYVFPTALLASDSLDSFLAHSPPAQEQPAAKDGDSDTESDDMISEEEVKVFREYRIPRERLDKLASVLQEYVGTKSFHNFTIGKPATDPSCQRFIRSFTIVNNAAFIPSDTDKDGGIEWCRVRVHGASFMLHQIRKMVGLAILAVRFNLNHAALLQAALANSPAMPAIKMNIPKAPGVGLFLDKAVFDGYNKYLSTSTAQGIPDLTIDFEKYEAERETIKRNIIYPAIFEPGVGQFAHWMKGLLAHNYEFKYLSDYQ